MIQSRPSYAIGIVLIAAGALCWSSAEVVVRSVEVSAWEVTFWRSLFMTIAMLPVLYPRRAKIIADCRAAGWSMVVSGALLAGCFVFFILALTHQAGIN